MTEKLRIVECRAFILAVTEKAEEMRVPVSIALANAEGHMLAMERMDDAGFITAEIAMAKAFTMAAFRSMSPRFPDGLVIQQWFKERNPQMMVNTSVLTGGRVVASGGCAPVFRGDDMIGAYGISGGTSDQDEAMGRYARQKVGWAHRAAHDTTPQDVKDHINALYDKAGLADRKL
ncbi:MAG: heme-binding protein [Betaproteobacteria bacterium]|nr:heme-binding protein [Betaproteobacteria bacterium]